MLCHWRTHKLLKLSVLAQNLVSNTTVVCGNRSGGYYIIIVIIIIFTVILLLQWFILSGITKLLFRNVLNLGLKIVLIAYQTFEIVTKQIQCHFMKKH